MLTQTGLKLWLNYNHVTGIFTWVKSNNPCSINVHSEGYWRIFLVSRYYYCHRLAWLYMTGEFPEEGIDHKNHNKADNRFCNLRKANHKVNGRNSKMQKNNSSGITGITFERGKYRARIWIEGKNISLGSFDRIVDAQLARINAQIKYDFTDIHGL